MMKVYFFGFIFFTISYVKAQQAPVKWASRETFFEELQGKKLPAFKGLSSKGAAFSSESLAGKIVLINFWFEACPPCVKEMPELNKLVKTYGSPAVKFIAITYDSPEKAKKFQKKMGFKYEVFTLTDDEIRTLNINHGYPSNILIGKDGRIIKAIGAVSFNDEDVAVKAQTSAFEAALQKEINQ